MKTELPRRNKEGVDFFAQQRQNTVGSRTVPHPWEAGRGLMSGSQVRRESKQKQSCLLSSAKFQKGGAVDKIRVWAGS